MFEFDENDEELTNEIEKELKELDNILAGKMPYLTKMEKDAIIQSYVTIAALCTLAKFPDGLTDITLSAHGQSVAQLLKGTEERVKSGVELGNIINGTGKDKP